jgi:hypothetical protein
VASKLAKLINNRAIILAIAALLASVFGVGGGHLFGDGLWDGL